LFIKDISMPSHHDAWLRDQQSRWLRPGSDRWARPDAARFLLPGTDVVKAFPALARKYNPDQPRVPAGSSDGGQWMDGNAGGAGSLGLFQITPRDNTIDGVRLAGDWPPDDGLPIPPRKPETTEGRMKFVRQSVRWLRVVDRLSPAADIFLGALDQAEDLKRLTDTIKTANDPPRTLEELQTRVQQPSEPGYQDHHIVGQFTQNRLQFGDTRIDSPENNVRIPTLKHLEINGWYSRPNDRFGGLSPRDYLRGKNWDEQLSIGMEVLRDQGVLK
jgi:hypothetical protein